MQASQNLSKLIEKWPSAYVARSEIARFTGGLMQSRNSGKFGFERPRA